MVEQVSSLKTGVKYKDTPIGKIPVDWEVVRLKDITGVGFDHEKTFARYICLYLDYNSDRLRSMFQGTFTNGPRKGDLESQLVSLPPILEQKKIVGILTTVNDAIEKTIRIIEKTKDLKKGLMHARKKVRKEMSEVLDVVCDVIAIESDHKKYLEMLKKSLTWILLTGAVRVGA